MHICGSVRSAHAPLKETAKRCISRGRFWIRCVALCCFAVLVLVKLLSMRPSLGSIDEPGRMWRQRESLSMRQSLGFIDEPDGMWRRRAETARRDVRAADAQTATTRIRDASTPAFHCANAKRLGGHGDRGDGGKWVCDVHSIRKNDCLLYSVGSNGDFSFERAVRAELGCEVHTFDPSTSGRGAPQGVHFHRYGLMTEMAKARSPDRNESFELYNLSTIVRRLGHEGRLIDLLKVDCEGCEINLPDALVLPGVGLVRQILVEVHQRIKRAPQFPAARRVAELLEGLARLGFVVFSKEANMDAAQYFEGEHCCNEISLLRLHPEFFGATTPMPRLTTSAHKEKSYVIRRFASPSRSSDVWAARAAAAVLAGGRRVVPPTRLVVTTDGRWKAQHLLVGHRLLPRYQLPLDTVHIVTKVGVYFIYRYYIYARPAHTIIN